MRMKGKWPSDMDKVFVIGLNAKHNKYTHGLPKAKTSKSKAVSETKYMI